MARPKPDIEATKAELVQAAEALLIQHGPDKVTVTDVASRCGMSQSNAYRFFPSKSVLLAAVADHWFVEFETALTGIVNGKGNAETRLRKFLLTQLKLKRDRFDADPSLFLAYLELAQGNMTAVWEHVHRMSAMLLEIVTEWLFENGVPTVQAKRVRDIIEDATLLFRDPNVIARRREECSDRRARLVVDNLLVGLLVTLQKGKL